MGFFMLTPPPNGLEMTCGQPAGHETNAILPSRPRGRQLTRRRSARERPSGPFPG
jgi:hypothetical protein